MIARARAEADLTFSVDGAEGTVSGSGQVLTVRVAEPARMLAALPSGTSGVAEIAELLASSGLRVEVQGPSGLLAQVGSGVHSRWGGWITGSRHVAPGSIRSLRVLTPVVTARLGRPAAAAALALVVLVALRAVRRRTD